MAEPLKCSSARRSVAAVCALFNLVWLLEAAEPESSFHAVSLSIPPSGKVGFKLLSPSETGITFTNELALRRGLTNQNLMNGSGVAAGDIDGDGRCDLYFCGLDVPNRLYRNLGDWKFEDITASAGVACAGQDSTGAVFADIDGDGDLDLLVTALGGGVRLFVNDGRGHFTERTDQAGLRSNAGSTSMALADFDGDGDLDLYVTNIPRRPVRNELSVRYEVKEINGERLIVAINGTPISAPELAGRFKLSPTGTVLEYGEADHFFQNNGDGTFKLLSFTDGRFLDEDGQPLKDPPMDWGLAVRFHDFNGDGLPDLYVCNDLFTPDRFWINQGGGRFRAIPSLAVRHTSLASMGIDVADINRDGKYDIFLSDMLSRDRHLRMTQFAHVSPPQWEEGVVGERLQFNHNALLLNRGDMTFAEIAFYGGVAASDWSWGGVFLDVDLDGYEDLLVPNGQQRNLAHADFATRMQAARRGPGGVTIDDMLKIAREFAPLDIANMAFRNRGDLTFEDVSAAWGFDTRSASQGMAMADLDNDGDLDLIVNNLLVSAGIYRNEGSAPRVAVRLKGLGKNTAGVGAQIKVTGGPVPQQQEMICGGRYLSGDQAMRVFATGKAERVDLEVLWRSGKRSRVAGALPNHLYEIFEAGAETSPRDAALEPKEGPLFEDVSDRIHHNHVELPFNDFQIQPLLPFHLTRSGPGISWFDLNRDGSDDLLVPSGLGGSPAVFLNQGRGTFRPVKLPPATDNVTADQTELLPWWPRAAGPTLISGFSTYKPGRTAAAALSFFSGSASSLTLNLDGPCGPLAMADIDGDGALDLFVGTTAKFGRYPEPGSGYLFRNSGGHFELAQKFEHVGIVKSAVFSDLNGDGYPELILACEWGPIRVFGNRKGKLVEATADWGLLDQTGLWQGVAAGDFDGDGRLDIVASNWGLNSSLHASRNDPQIFYYGDVDGNGSVEMFEVTVDLVSGKEYPAANLNVVSMALPVLRERVPDYETYARTTIQELLGDSFKKLTRIELRNFAATVFLNRGDHFEAHPLPAEAQFAPSFGVAVADFDGDGHVDLFLSQNCFGVGIGMSRQDAGRGLLLRGDGQGGFQPIPGQTSGIMIYGEQRGCAAADFDKDGRVDLAVTQNNFETKLYRNSRGIPGLRVRLRGPAENPLGIGAILRSQQGGRWGSAVELHAGEGYWSVNSAVSVLALPVEKILVQWPGGEKTEHPVARDSREVFIDYSAAR